MPIELPLFWVLLLNVAGWPIVQFGLAWCFTRLPVALFEPPPARAWEDGGRFYERYLRVRRWKDRLPDAAAWFEGGFPKARLVRRQPAYLRRFAQETWRGELCHWCAFGCVPVFFLWNPLWADLVMVAYATLANLPCIVVQRYNRLRLARALGS